MGTQLIESPKSEHLNVFSDLVETTDRNDQGFPLYILDYTMIPVDILNRNKEHAKQILEAVKIKLAMIEGYPAFEFHKPIWTKLPHEPEMTFNAFKNYLISPIRSFEEALVALPPEFTPLSLKEAYIYFYWEDRARAYDIYRPVAARRITDQRLLALEDTHYNISQGLIESFISEIKQRSDEQNNRPWAGMKASELFSSLGTSMGLQRVSLGLPANAPKNTTQSDTAFSPTSNSSFATAIDQSHQNFEGKENIKDTSYDQLRTDINLAMASNPEAVAELEKAAINLMLQARKGPQKED